MRRTVTRDYENEIWGWQSFRFNSHSFSTSKSKWTKQIYENNYNNYENLITSIFVAFFPLISFRLFRLKGFKCRSLWRAASWASSSRVLSRGVYRVSQDEQYLCFPNTWNFISSLLLSSKICPNRGWRWFFAVLPFEHSK